ncbi:MAG: hypothetical protein RR547_12215, partial [Raoultibacter sp.]
EAIRYMGDIESDAVVKSFVGYLAYDSYARPIIKTLEGDMAVQPGDYIIKGVQGEFCPCKPDIFDATYELVGE